MGIIESSFQENSFIFLMVIGILIMLALALAFVLFVNHSQKKILASEMRIKEQAFDHQEQLLHSTIITQEEERKRIARELHDEIGSKLNVILLNIHHFRKWILRSDESDELVEEMKSLINNTIDTTRRISHDLLPPTLEEFGLIEAIKELRDSYHHVDNLSIKFNYEHGQQRFNSDSVELNLYRVIQELINNSIKHGKAKNISLDLTADSTRCTIEYVDDGIGFERNQLENKKGLGMKNIESRLNMINAKYSFDSSPGKGITASINLSF